MAGFRREAILCRGSAGVLFGHGRGTNHGSAAKACRRTERLDQHRQPDQLLIAPLPVCADLVSRSLKGQDSVVVEPDVKHEIDALTERLRNDGWAPHVTVERLIRDWQRLADEVSAYPMTIDDYTNDVSGRDALELILSLASANTVAVIGPPIADADARFRDGTTDDGGKAISRYFRTENKPGWWWTRRPSSGELADYLDQAR